MATATMTSKGQLTVPKEIRDRLGLKPGDRVDFVPTGGDGVAMRKRRVVPLRELLGSLPNNGISKTLDELEQDLGDAIAEHVMRR
jgi:antitoxin PrlF